MSFDTCFKCANRNTAVCKGCVGWNRFRSQITIPSPSFSFSISNDIAAAASNRKEMTERIKKKNIEECFAIKRVIYSYPATVVLWEDGTKTIVKAGDYDVYDPEKGLAMAIAKKAFGNQGSYYEVFKKWLPDMNEKIGVGVKHESKQFSINTYTVREYCEKYGLTRSKVQNMITRGELNANKNTKGHWVIYEEV